MGEENMEIFRYRVESEQMENKESERTCMGHNEDPDTRFEAFVSTLNNAVTHLYDPSYSPPSQVWSVLRCDREQGLQNVWHTLVNTIESLRPPEATPQHARAWRVYQTLNLRYVQQYTQENAAEEMGITPRHLRREQKSAMRILARKLWDSYAARPDSSSSPALVSKQGQAWYDQLQQEMQALKTNLPNAVSDLRQVLKRVMELSEGFLAGENGSIRMASGVPQQLVAVHGSVLTQILMRCITVLMSAQKNGTVIVNVLESDENHILVHLQAGTTENTSSVMIPSEVQELAHWGEIVIEPSTNNQHSEFRLTLPIARERKVLVIDDNRDLVHFYRRYTFNTRYRIQELDEGQDILTAISQVNPDIIVLDVMLPDADGWELLSRIQQDPHARMLPIVVCTIMEGEALAMSLGASVYVQKPVGRQEFLNALDRTSNRFP